jgi:4-amino-4-deoxy-L-arabinose transferase-like glycosyltransferase
VREAWRRLGQGWPAAGLILAVTLPLYVAGLGDRHIWIPLEARYGLVAREMLEGGHWILPHLGGQVYPDKPPFLFWAIASLSAWTSGVSEWTARLPSALAAVSVCLVTWRMGAQLFSPAAGLLAALALATSAGFFWSGRQALPDMLLTLWTTSACWAFWEWMTAKRPLAALLAGICLALATLTKGPVGLLLPTLAAVAYLALRWDWQTLRGRGLSLCLGAYLGIVLSWYLPALWQGGIAYAEATLLHHSVERYLNAWEHTAPWYFYLGAFPAEFLPWTLFLPQALASGVAQRQRAARSGWWFVVCWLGSIGLFFSFSSGKRDIYMLPAFPAAALLVGWSWSQWKTQSPTYASQWGWRLPTLALALALWGLAGGIGAAASGMLPAKSTLLLPTEAAARRWMGALLIVGGGLLVATALSGRARLACACLMGCTWGALVLVVIAIYTPQFNQRYPIKPFAAAVRAAVPPHQPLGLCGPMNDLALRFNLGRDAPLLAEEAEIARYFDREQRVFCVLTQATYDRLVALYHRPLPVLAQREIDGAAMLLIANRP